MFEIEHDRCTCFISTLDDDDDDECEDDEDDRYDDDDDDVASLSSMTVATSPRARSNRASPIAK